MKKSLLLLLILSTTFFGFGQTYLNTQKTLADAIAVKNALDILTHGGSNPSILPYAEKITGQQNPRRRNQTHTKSFAAR